MTGFKKKPYKLNKCLTLERHRPYKLTGLSENIHDVPDEGCIATTMGIMKERVIRLNDEYGFGLSEEEIEIIARQAEKANELFKQLDSVDLSGVMPVLTLNKMPRK